MQQQKHLPCKWHPFHPGSMFPGLSRHVRYECCAVDLQEVSTQQGRKCRDAEMRCWGSSELNISADISARWCWPMRTSGLCLLCLCCRRFVDSFFFHVSPRLVCLNQDPEKPSQQNEKISEDLTCCTLLLWRGSFLLLPWWFTTLWPMASREAWEKVNGKVEDHGNYIELHHKHP